MESRAGQPPTAREWWTGDQAESAAAAIARRGRRRGRGPAAAATAAAQRRQWHERVASRSGPALDRAGRAAHAPRSHGAHAPRHAGGSEGLVTGILSVVTAVFVMQGAEVTASVDRTHLRVGEELMLTIRAHTRAADPVEIMLPPLSGFAIVGTRDMTEVAISGGSGSIRTTVRELQLRAQQPGALLNGRVRPRQGSSVVATDPILLTVDSAADRTTSTLSPLARSLLETTPAPVSRRTDRVALTMLVPSDTVFAGQQVDLIAAAWIPRELGERMRRPPLLTLATPEGVWAYPTAPSGAALSRQVNGHWMDLFIAHQVVFPLAAGRLIVPPASVEYALPVTFSFFSREERYTLRSDSIAITVLPLPSPHTTNVVGERVSLDLQVDPASTRVGEPVEASVTVSG